MDRERLIKQLEIISRYWTQHEKNEQFVNIIVKRISSSVNRYLSSFKDITEDNELKNSANILIEASTEIMNTESEDTGVNEELVNAGKQFFNDLQTFIEKLKS